MSKDCHNKILAVLRSSENGKAFKTQTVPTDTSQNLIYKLLVDVAWSPIPVKYSYKEHSCVGQNMVCRHVQYHICRCHDLLAAIPHTEMHHESEKRKKWSRCLTKWPITSKRHNFSWEAGSTQTIKEVPVFWWTGWLITVFAKTRNHTSASAVSFYTAVLPTWCRQSRNVVQLTVGDLEVCHPRCACVKTGKGM